MDGQRNFYREFGGAVVNIIIPFLMGIFNLLIIITDMLEWCFFRVFDRRQAQIVEIPAINETSEQHQSSQPESRYDDDNRESGVTQQSAQPRRQCRPPQIQNNQNNTSNQVMQLLEDDDTEINTIQQARLVLSLMDLQFSRDESIDAAKNCDSVEAAISYLNHRCEACDNTYSMSQMIYMLKCTHCCCRSCAKGFFSLQVMHHGITDCVCPYCRLPNLNSSDTSMYEIKEYFERLSVMLKNILAPHVHEVFQRKLNDFLNETEAENNDQTPNNTQQTETEEPENFASFARESLQQSTPGQSRTQPKKPSEFDLMEHKALTLMQDGKVNNFSQAELAVTMMSIGIIEDQALEASRNCRNLEDAISYLNQECSLCQNKFAASQMISLLECEHQICCNCTKNHFTLKITDHNITDCTCPICELPHLEGEEMSDQISNYLAKLDIVLRRILDEDVHEQFQQKMRDYGLRDDQNKEEPLSEELQRQARQFVTEHRVGNYMQSEIAIRLIQDGHSEPDALEAVRHCSTLNGAISYIDQECAICTNKFKMNEMVTMLSCEDHCCTDCTRNYFTNQINELTIADLNCPFCKIPNLNDEEMEETDKIRYISNLDILLKNIIPTQVHDVFQKKVRDWSLRNNPNFKWCPQCASGFIIEGTEQRVTCPDCRAISCVNCRKPWQDQHAGLTCERFTEWQEANDPANQEIGLNNHLATSGIDCPKCKHRFSLTRGGCMHFTCSQCKYEFCQGCAKPYSRACSVGGCRSGGLHAHHPRNCLYYLRDREPAELQGLLQKYKVPYNTEKPTASPTTPDCYIMLQTSPGRDHFCGNTVQQGHAGLCRLHYIEYLAGLINTNPIDPVDIMELPDITIVLNRSGIEAPKHDPDKMTPEAYKDTCAKMVKTHIPLD